MTEERPGRAPRRKFVVRLDGGDDDAVRIEDAAAVAAVADPVRIRILKRLGEPMSAKDLAAELGRPVTSLYHHLDLLEEHGLIQVVDVTKEGRALVRRYQRRGNRFESAAQRLSFAVRDDRDADQRLQLLLRGPLDPGRLGELGRRLQDTVTEFLRDRSDDAVRYDVVVTVSPTEEDER